MKTVFQPEGSVLCGQCCVAALTGCSLDEAIEELGSGRTNVNVLRDFLRKRGFRTGDKLTRIRARGWTAGNQYAIVRILLQSKPHRSHWVLWDREEGCFHCPVRGRFWRVDPRMTSFLWVLPPEGV